ncbi:DNA polymerase [turkey adenovirus 4]|uniref:DNA polymerase n=3 Tax=turkey adenovirus 4 TaxID=1408257 RepID=U5NHJ3_9ADEN|nr:DNA polymerase [Turkey aviadenovirus 4]AGX93301.1 DNA polymerase [Turkey aviadenovirus 4]
MMHSETNRCSHLHNTLLGEDSKYVKFLSAEQYEEAKKHFKTVKGNPLRANVFYIDNEPYRLQPSVFHKGMKKFLRLHHFLLASKRSRAYDRIDYGYYQSDPVTRLAIFKPAYVGLVHFKGKQAIIKRFAERDNPVLPPMLVARNQQNEWVWITSRTAVQTCPTCGRHWVRNHTCNERRSAFFYHAVQKQGKDMWQHVRFSCPAQYPHCKQLFVTYDIETYTVFEPKGKRMHPFMLCFMLSGDAELVELATQVALMDPDLNKLDEGFYWLNTEPGVVARRFRAYRSRLQQTFAEDLVERYAKSNRAYCQKMMSEGQYSSIFNIPYELFAQPTEPLTLPEDFYNVHIVILGHNICKFDELLLATELVERRDAFPEACRCDRFFMPRVGRLLFNDVLFHLPNPNYIKKDPTRLHRWAKGVVSHQDSRSVMVRFMVRDTLQLTSGAKLSKAAAAYALELSKGQCPYEAINEYIAFGHFQQDDEGFPVPRYWEDSSVIPEQKTLWQTQHPGQRYDIIKACLEYCMQDVRVTKKLAHTLLESYDRYFREELGMHGRFNIFMRPTIPSNTHAFWKQLTFSAYVEDHEKRLAFKTPDPSDKENHAPRQRGKGKKKKQKHPSPDYVAEVYAPHRAMFKYIRQALRGGRCYPSVLGPYRHQVYVFDICGMYASALTHPMPHGMPLDPKFTAIHVDELNKLMESEASISYFDPRIKPSILKVEAYPPPSEQLDTLPPICSRRGGRLVWTNEALYDEVITILDIITLHNRGWKVTALHDEMNIVFPAWKTICSEYVTKNINAKEKADREKNEVMRSISKMLSNALYGAFATNMDTTRILFEQDLTDDDRQQIYQGTQVVRHVTLLNDNSLSGTVICPADAPGPDSFKASELNRYFIPHTSTSITEDIESEEGESAGKVEDALTSHEASLAEIDQELQEALDSPPYIGESDPRFINHAHYASANETKFKPIRLLDAPPEALTVLHLENLDKQVENKRYATQIACFVLGWSRAFFSEWCEILHGPDKGTHLLKRAPQTLYGDTDSLFVTASGYARMKERGSHRIKNQNTRLTFDPEHPALYWACDCDIKCKRCGGDTYSSEAIFLAPKLYGLKDAVCLNPECGHVGTGKIRSKGHKQAELLYETLERCWQRHEDQLYGGISKIPELHTRRTIFKTTLLNKVSRYDPFTIHNEQLTRILRPWKDLTQYQHGDFLYPYDTEHPNPRTSNDVRNVPPVGHEDPLAPLRFLEDAVDGFDLEFHHTDPNLFLSVEDCDSILDALSTL